MARRPAAQPCAARIILVRSILARTNSDSGVVHDSASVPLRILAGLPYRFVC